MNFTKAIKVFELNVLRQAGITVTPDQVGLKTDPIADLQAKTAQNSFSSILSKFTGGGTTGLIPPTPPTPPADPADLEAQAQYQQDLMTYQNNFQIYNQRFMQLMMSQMQSMQQAMANSQRQSASQSSASSTSDDVSLGIGGILDGL